MPLLPPMPVISVPAPPLPPLNTRSVNLVSFAPGSVTCDGQAIAPVALARPFAAVAVWYGQTPEPPKSYRFAFSIDASGRAHAIRKLGVSGPAYYIDTNDLPAALAASRFAAAAPRQNCSLVYDVTVTPVATAPLTALYEVASQPATTAPASEIFDRVRPDGSTCARGPGPYRQVNAPAFEKIAQPPSSWAWTFLAFDVDPSGKVRDVRSLGSSGNAALDRASVQALSHNRYAPGPGHRGCIFHFFRAGGNAALPTDLPAETPADTGDLPACSIDPKTVSSLFDGSAYPVAFSRRRIEGAAAIRYDTAPWGAIGNVTVLASEPDEAFGETARGRLSSAMVRENAVGHRGCVRRIRFRLPPAPSPE